MSPLPVRSHVWALLLAVLQIVAGRASAEGEPVERGAFDCGTLALYTLLRLEGHHLDLKVFEARLPAPRDRGYSMEELRSAARSFDIELSGVQIIRSDRAPDRPILAFLRHQPHGHYLVIRPVGHSGRLVQVLDPNRSPYVLDATSLYDSPEWTGIALLPERPRWRVWTSIGFILAASLAVLIRVRRLREIPRPAWARMRPSPVPLTNGGQIRGRSPASS